MVTVKKRNQRYVSGHQKQSIILYNSNGEADEWCPDMPTPTKIPDQMLSKHTLGLKCSIYTTHHITCVFLQAGTTVNGLTILRLLLEIIQHLINYVLSIFGLNLTP